VDAKLLDTMKPRMQDKFMAIAKGIYK